MDDVTGAKESADDFAATENSQWFKSFMNDRPSELLALHEFKTTHGFCDTNLWTN